MYLTSIDGEFRTTKVEPVNKKIVYLSRKDFNTLTEFAREGRVELDPDIAYADAGYVDKDGNFCVKLEEVKITKLNYNSWF